MTDQPDREPEREPPASPSGLELTALDLGADVVFVTDREGTIVDVNDAFVRVTGYSREEAIGSTPRLLSSGLQGEEFYAEMWRTITSGEMWEGELVDRRRDGALRSHQVTITPVRDGSGRITHFVAVERDMSDELARQATSDAAGLAHTDVTGRCVYADGRVAGLLGCSVSNLLGDGLLAALDPDDAQELQDVVTMAAETGREHRLEIRAGEDTWLGIEVGPLTVASGAVIGARLAFEDITDRVRVARELARREALLASVLDAIEEPVAVVDRDGRVVITNESWRQRSGEERHDTLDALAEGDDLLASFGERAAGRDQVAGRIAEDLRVVLAGTEGRRDGADTGVRITPLAWEEGGAVLRLVAADPDAG